MIIPLAFEGSIISWEKTGNGEKRRWRQMTWTWFKLSVSIWESWFVC